MHLSNTFCLLVLKTRRFICTSEWSRPKAFFIKSFSRMLGLSVCVCGSVWIVYVCVWLSLNKVCARAGLHSILAGLPKSQGATSHGELLNMSLWWYSVQYLQQTISPLYLCPSKLFNLSALIPFYVYPSNNFSNSNSKSQL